MCRNVNALQWRIYIVKFERAPTLPSCPSSENKCVSSHRMYNSHGFLIFVQNLVKFIQLD